MPLGAVGVGVDAFLDESGPRVGCALSRIQGALSSEFRVLTGRIAARVVATVHGVLLELSRYLGLLLGR